MADAGTAATSILPETTGAAGARTLPKLPQLDPAHVKAISASLPGRLLGRTAALLSFAALLFGFWALLEPILPDWATAIRQTHRMLFNAGFYGLPLLIVTAHLVREAVEQWRTRRMRARVIDGMVTDPRYFRLTPYTARDRERFHRADGADAQAAAWIEEATSPILYLTGDSGVGKSSLLEAGVIPGLRESGWTVVPVRGLGDPEAAIVEALKAPDAVWKEPPATAELADLIRRASQHLVRRDSRLCIVVDQFEETLILPDAAARERFAQCLQHLAGEPGGGPVLLLVIRSEYEPLLLDLGATPLRQAETWFKLHAFTEPSARAFIDGSGLALAPGQLERVLKGAAALEQTRGLFRPIILNMLGLVLSRYAGILPEGLDLERIIQHHLEESLANETVRSNAVRLLPLMITEAATKWPRYESELSGESGLPLGNVRHCLLALADAGLVRPIGRDPVVWEVAHDFIALQLALLLGRIKRPAWRAALPYAVPVLAVLWLALIVGGAAVWPEWNYREAVRALNTVGFRVEGSNAEGHRIFSRQARFTEDDFLVDGAVSRFVEHGVHIPNIVYLEIWGDKELKSFAGFLALDALQSLTISSNDNLTYLQGLPALDALQSLEIYNNDNLTSLQGLPSLEKLETLVVTGPELVDLSAILPRLVMLKRLALEGDGAAEGLSACASLEKLDHIVVKDNSEVRSAAKTLLGDRAQRGLPQPTTEFVKTENEFWRTINPWFKGSS